MSRVTFIRIIVSLAILLTAGVAGATPIVDQWSTPNTTWWASIQYNQPIGQSITPSMPGIDWAEFLITGGTIGSFRVDVHSGSYGGTLVGSSNVLTFGGGVAHFTFGSTLALTPGNLYYLMVVQLAGNNFGLLGDGCYCGNYAGGGLVVDGYDYTLNYKVQGPDLWFREGMDKQPIPEPGTMLLMSSGLALLVRKLRK